MTGTAERVFGRLRAARSESARPWLTAIALVAIVAAGAAVRLIDLSGHPGGLYPDEAAEGVTALRLLHDPGYLPVFTPEDGGRETLFAYVVAAAFRFFGTTTTVLRGTSAVMGSVAITGLFLAGRRYGRGVALAAALWGAGSLWLIAVSRDGFRNVFAVLVGAFALAALMRWHDLPRRSSTVLAGIYTAFGLWTYQPLKLLPILVVAWLYLLRRRDRERYRLMLAHRRWLVAGFAVVAAPMMVVAVTDPASYFGRAADVSLFNPAQQHNTIIVHTLRTLGQFFIWGDPNPRHDVDGLPLLGLPLTALAVLGGWRAWRGRSDAVNILVLLAIPLMLVAPLAALEGDAPHFLRDLGLAPYLAVLIGLGCAEAVALAGAWRGTAARAAGAAGVALLLVGLGAASTRAYLARPVAAVYDAYSFPLAALSDASAQGAGTLAVVDDYSAFDVAFLADGNPPTVVAPGSAVGRPALYSTILALDPGDVERYLEPGSRRAHPIAFDPSGEPRVFVAAP